MIAVIASLTAVSVSAAMIRATCTNCGDWGTVIGSKAIVYNSIGVNACSAINAKH